MAKGRVVMGLLFFPRGGSAQVTRYLAPALIETGWDVSVVAGSLGAAGEETHAPTFFDGIDLRYVDYTDAFRVHRAGGSAVAAPVPMHPSYEDRGDVPDVVLASVDPSLAWHLASIWEAPFLAAGANQATVFHLHHLTPQHDAVAHRWPNVAVVAHLHGTELKLLEAIEERAEVAAALGFTLATIPDIGNLRLPPGALDERQDQVFRTTRWDRWRHGEFWLGHLRRQAESADHLVVVSPPDCTTAVQVLDVAAEHVSAIPNGVDLDLFRPRRLTPDERRASFRRWLIEDPQGWDESGVAGTIAYREADLDRLVGADGTATVLMFVGRFTSAKRVPRLVRAFAQARPHFQRPASLVVWGGHPGEWEDEHPFTVASEVGREGIFFTGWRGHGDLPDGLAACDALVMPSVNDSYPQTPLEAMAAGVPVIATKSGGFPSMINLDPAHPTGWLVAPDDESALVAALVEAVNRPEELARRGAGALSHAQANLSWSSMVSRFVDVYALAGERRRRRHPRVQPGPGPSVGGPPRN
jgi:D-inositol-3-phosphate glycosyltransferase